MISQKEAVFKAVMKFSKSARGLNDETKAKIYAQLTRDFAAGKVRMNPKASNLVKLSEERELRTYIIGLVSNWLRKDKRLTKRAA